MPNAFATTAQLTCDGCGQPFSADLWLIVDTVERPDLLARLRAQTLHDVPCPHCQQTTTLDVPLLVFRPDQRPVLTFLPRWQSDAVQNRQDARQLLGLLQANLGAAWDDRWLDEADSLPPLDEAEPAPSSAPPADAADDEQDALPPALAALLAELAAEGVHLANEGDLQRLLTERPELQERFAAALQDETPPLLRAINALVRAQSWDELQRSIETHPELLEEAAITFFDQLIAQQDDERLRQMLAAQQTLLQRCRVVGVARAFAEKQLPPEALAEAERLGLTPEDFLAAQRAADEMPPALREVLATLAAEGVEIHSAAGLDAALATRPALRAKLLTLEEQPRCPDLPPALQPILDELTHLTQRRDMPRRIELCRQALTLVERRANAPLWAALQVELGNSLAQNPLGSRAQNLEEALAAYQQALQVRTRDAMPIEWAQTINNLANAYYSRIRGDRAQNLEEALAAYQQALQVRTRDAMPIEWAQTINNLANAYGERIRGDRAQNLEEAIAAYQQALQVYTRDAMHIEWAHTINNLALAYRNRIRGDRAQNLEEALAACQQALQVYTRDAMPIEWAHTINNLAFAYVERIRGDRAQNLEEALAAYQQALQVRTRDAMPIEWAQTINNLAFAYRNRIRGDRAQNLEEAIAACQQALQVHTRDAMPIQWAQTMMNLALAYAERIRGDRAQNLEEAIAAYQQALQVRTRDAMPIEWAQTINNLALAYRNRIRGDRAQNLEEAIAAYQQALQVYTRDAMHIEWATTINNLANAYYSRIRGDRAQNLEEAIAAYQQALQVRTRDAMPIEWAQTINNLANAYGERIRGDRAQNLEEAIAAYQQALQVMTRDAMHIEWATTINNLANAYYSRIRGDRAQNLEEALAAYQQALQVYTRDAMPIQWATTINNLAFAYRNRIRGDRAQNLEEAIAACQQALQVYTRDAMPIQWAQTMMNLALAYAERIRGDRAQNLEEAIAAYQQALQVHTRDAMPIQWAQTINNLANAYIERIRGDRAQNLEEAIAAYQQALQVHTRDAMPIEWAQTINNLAITYRNRIRGDRAQNLEEAIAAYQQALQVHTRDAMPIQWAQTMMNLALAYAERIRGDRAQNLEEAIAAYQQALQVRTRDAMPIEWAQTINNLANAYGERIRGDRAQNLEEAIAAYQQALQVHTRDAMPIQWAQTINNLAITYRNRIRGDRAQNLEEAIAACQQALQVYTRDAMPIQWAQTINNLAITYVERIRGDRAQNLEEAIAAYQQALTIQTVTAAPTEHRRVQRNLGNAYMVLVRWAAAATAFEGALAAGELLYTTAATPEARQAELRENQGVPATLAYALARQAAAEPGQLQAAVVTLERNRARWLAESLALRRAQPAGVADSLWQGFTTAAEQMRALIQESQLPDNTPSKRAFLTLSPLLAAARHALQTAVAAVRAQAPDFMPEPSFAELHAVVGKNVTGTFQSAGHVDALVYLLTTAQSGLALIVHRDGVEPVWLDVTDAQVRAWLFGPAAAEAQLGGWFGAYQAWLVQRTKAAQQAWFDQIEATTHQLWDALMGPLAAALHSLPTPPQTVTLIPSGLLALLPLHAAWTEATAGRAGDGSEAVPVDQPSVSRPRHAVDQSPSPSLGEGPGMGVHYFLDDFAVSYAPSALALRHAQERLATVATQRVLAIDEPQPVHGGPLPNSSREVAAIVDHFAQPTILAHEAATRPAVLQALADGVDVAHFSCHGGNNWGQPLQTALFMADNDPLTVRDLLDLRLPGARLASLSACETGLVGTALPDEVVMLPSALLQAGFAGVAASLWSVADVSTAMLMARFYDLWQGVGPEQKIAPVQALRQAQQWVRDTTNREKAAYFATQVPELQPNGATKMAAGVAAEFFSAALLHDDGPEARTFAHPFWWAAFTFTGV